MNLSAVKKKTELKWNVERTTSCCTEKSSCASAFVWYRRSDPLEKELESFNPKFDEYDELTENGNYLQAREIVISLTEKGNMYFRLIEEIPSFLWSFKIKFQHAIREFEMA